jgi:hypothetical protein
MYHASLGKRGHRLIDDQAMFYLLILDDSDFL